MRIIVISRRNNGENNQGHYTQDFENKFISLTDIARYKSGDLHDFKSYRFLPSNIRKFLRSII